MIVSICVDTCTITFCGDQRAGCRNWVSFSITWVSGCQTGWEVPVPTEPSHGSQNFFPLGGYEGVGADYIGLTYAGQVSLLSCSP